MTADFPTLVGRFIHHCGALEFFTNNAIKAFATDPLLSTDAIESTWHKRIGLLRRLLHERSDVKKNDIKSLCDELDEVRKQRNIVAHNPIVSTEPNGSGTEVILIVRHKPAGATIPEEITRDDVAGLVEQTCKLMKKFAKLVPDATKT